MFPFPLPLRQGNHAGRFFAVKEFSHVPTTAVEMTPGGPFLMSRMAPRTPQEPPGGESFDSLSPWTPILNDQGRGAAAPLPWNPPQVVLFRAIGPAPALRSGGRAQRTPRPLRSKAEGSSCFRRTVPGGFPKGRGRSPCPLVVSRGSLRGEIEIPPQGFFGGLGAFFAAKNAPKRPSPPLWWRYIGHS